MRRSQSTMAYAGQHIAAQAGEYLALLPPHQAKESHDSLPGSPAALSRPRRLLVEILLGQRQTGGGYQGAVSLRIDRLQQRGSVANGVGHVFGRQARYGLGHLLQAVATGDE